MKTYIKQISQFSKPIRGKLSRLDIELTERCNNSCIHCYINLPVNDRSARDKELSLEELKDILTQAANLGCMTVRFTGGEPLLRPDFDEIYEYTRRLGMRVLIFTNARLITPRLVELFKRIPPLEKIEVTVYGMHPESYEANTLQTGSFNSFWQGVQMLLENNIPFVVKSAILPANRDEFDEFELWAQTIPWMQGLPSYAMFFELRARRDDAQKNELIASLRLHPEEGMVYAMKEKGEMEQFRDGYWQSMVSLPGKRLFACGAGAGQLTVDAYGRIQACLELRAPALALPKGTSLAAALEHFKGLKELSSSDPEYLQRCANCFLRNLCDQCPAKAWSESGTLDTPVQYLCDVSHAMARRFGWLGEDEWAWQVVDWEERIHPKTR